VSCAHAATFAPGTPLDNCNRADEDPISQGGNWTNQIISADASTVVCAANGIDKGAAAGAGSAFRGSFGPDVQVSLEILDADGGNNSIDLYLRLAGTAAARDGYACRFWPTDANQQIILARLDDSVHTTLTSQTTTNISNGDVVGCEMIGTTLTAYYCPGGTSCTAVLSTTSATYSAAGPVGLAFRSTTAFNTDNFWAATVSAGGAGRRFVAPIIFP
jgi:hypothetical protein